MEKERKRAGEKGNGTRPQPRRFLPLSLSQHHCLPFSPFFSADTLPTIARLPFGIQPPHIRLGADCISDTRQAIKHECRGVRAELADSNVPRHRGDRVAGSGHAGLRVRLHRLHPAEPDPGPDPEPAGQPGERSCSPQARCQRVSCAELTRVRNGHELANS